MIPREVHTLLLSRVRIPERRINQGLIDGGKISVGADWWKVLVIRDLPAAR